MTREQIEREAAREKVKHDTAIAIRGLLNEARDLYGRARWDAEDTELAVLALVTGESVEG